MISLILSTVSWLVLPVMLVFSFHLMLRGHNLPGGGFIAGLMTAAAIVLQYLARNGKHVKENFRVNYRALIALGLAMAGGMGAGAWFYGGEFLEHRFGHFSAPLIGEIELATALVFDLGVYCVVVGMVLMLIATVGEEN
jgi:multicomponent K+:H+ antiporter subunit A